jgi:hypothetical protein
MLDQEAKVCFVPSIGMTMAKLCSGSCPWRSMWANHVDFALIMEGEGVHHLIIPYSPQQNGVVER